MIAHGAPHGLVDYWENKISVPANPSTIPPAQALTMAQATTLGRSLIPITTSTTSPSTSPLHSLTPSFPEYQLCESVTLLSILINLINIPGTGVNPRGKSHEAWALLKEQYGKDEKHEGKGLR